MKIFIKAARIFNFLAFLFLSAPLIGQNLDLEMIVDAGSLEFGRVTATTWTKQEILKLQNLSEKEWKQILQVYTGVNVKKGQPAILGSYGLLPNGIIFNPRFPPVPGLSYTICVDKSILSTNKREKYNSVNIIEKVITIYETDYKVTELRAIYPALDSLPANLLRFYLHFTAPMSFENPYSHIKLFGQDGNEISDPFVEVKEGLWDQERKRLTLFIHPGRIKRGVSPNIKQGPVLENGKNYTLSISSGWKDAQNKPLNEDYKKDFYVFPAIRKQLDFSKLRLSNVRSNSRDTLLLDFNRILDHALVLRMFSLWDMSNNPVKGIYTYLNKTLQFIPINNWTRGYYILIINTKLEDLAGNTVNYIFDKEINSIPASTQINDTIDLSFLVQ